MIRGWFDSIDGWPVPRVRATVSLHGLSGASLTTASISFLIDTGSGISALHPLDATKRVGIPRAWLADKSRWSRQHSVSGIGGTTTYFIVACRYGFEHAGGRTQEVDGVIRVAPLTQSNQQLPSVLGWDVLRHFRLTADLRSRELTLE
jgi:hypothetical protein